jgi:hypothetical protein
VRRLLGLETGGARAGEVAVSAFNALKDKHILWKKLGSRVMGWLTIKLIRVP